MSTRPICGGKSQMSDLEGFIPEDSEFLKKYKKLQDKIPGGDISELS